MLTQQRIPHGTENLGRLKSVFLHRPETSVHNLNRVTAGYYLFDSIPNPEIYLAEHDRYRKLLLDHGVQVHLLAGHVRQTRSLMDTLPSLAYLHDIAVITRRGAILSKMGFGRQGEDSVVREAILNLGVPIFYEFSDQDHFEGCLPISANTLLIAHTERHRDASIQKAIPTLLTLFDEVIYVEVPKTRRFMHADMVFGLISPHLALYFRPAFLETRLYTAIGVSKIDFEQYSATRGMELIAVSDDEQKHWGCSFVPLEANKIIHYDIALSARTKNILATRGVDLIEFHPEALLAGGGSLRCLTLQLYRE